MTDEPKPMSVAEAVEFFRAKLAHSDAQYWAEEWKQAINVLLSRCAEPTLPELAEAVVEYRDLTGVCAFAGVYGDGSVGLYGNGEIPDDILVDVEQDDIAHCIPAIRAATEAERAKRQLEKPAEPRVLWQSDNGAEEIVEPAGESWDDFERGVNATFAGGHHTDGKMDAYRHGINTVCNILRAHYAPPDVCRKAKQQPAEPAPVTLESILDKLAKLNAADPRGFRLEAFPAIKLRSNSQDRYFTSPAELDQWLTYALLQVAKPEPTPLTADEALRYLYNRAHEWGAEGETTHTAKDLCDIIRAALAAKQ
jgi:hypothetical protein